MTTLRSTVAYLALMIRCAGTIYIVVQVVIWHTFYTADSWRLVAPVVAVAWALTVVAYLRRRWPSPLFACADCVVYVALALGAQECVPPPVRDDMFSWLVIAMSGQLMVPAWFAPGAASGVLAFVTPMAYWTGATLQPVTNARTIAMATIVLIVVGLVHGYGRRQLYHRAAVADAALAEADRAATEQYAILSRSIERREHERLLHDTVLNTLTALARAGRDDVAGAVHRCRQDVASIDGALRDGRPSGDLLSAMRAVIDEVRARGLTVHVAMDDGTGASAGAAPAVPDRVVAAISNAAREALSNVAEHAGTGEAWVEVSLTAPEQDAGDADVPCRLRVIVRDMGAGFDPARVDRARLGVRRSIAERAQDCGGQASISSQPGQGTVVCLSWPGRVLASQGLPW
jgi:signal transduction histidine kinase